jgi:hypothetical protein
MNVTEQSRESEYVGRDTWKPPFSDHLVKHLKSISLAALLVLMVSQPGLAAVTNSSTAQKFGGASSVPGQLADDKRLTESLTGVDMPGSYSDWKKACARNMAWILR